MSFTSRNLLHQLLVTHLLRGCGAVAAAMFAVSSLLLLASCGGSSNERAPGFQLTRFDGSDFTLSEQAGRIVVLNFWYPSCPPCREEMPAIQAAWQLLRDEGAQFLGVFVPLGFDSEQDARDFVSQLGLTYPFATDLGARVAQAYQVEHYPMTFFIDESGRISQQELGVLDAEEIARTIRNMTRS